MITYRKGGLRTVLVSIPFLFLGGCLHSCSHFLPNGLTLSCKVSYCWEFLHIAQLNKRIECRFSKNDFVWATLGGSIRGAVHIHFCVGKILRPFGVIPLQQKAQDLFQSPVHAFCLTICLRMVSRTEP